VGGESKLEGPHLDGVEVEEGKADHLKRRGAHDLKQKAMIPRVKERNGEHTKIKKEYFKNGGSGGKVLRDGRGQ